MIDWFSRYVIACRVSIALDGGFCLDLLNAALERGRPEIFNTDQGKCGQPLKRSPRGSWERARR